MVIDADLGDKLWELGNNYTIMVPCTWEYIFNDAQYQYMARDTVRNDAYRKVIQQTVKDKTVIEIGPGSMLVLTLLCLKAGAKKIYAIEIDEDAYYQAQALIIARGLTSKVELIYGSSLDIDLPEKGDVCVSELIGCIGGSEGAARLQHDAKRFLKPEGVMIPTRCLTMLSPVFKPEIYQNKFLEQAFTLLTEEVYQVVGKKFPFPYHTISNFPATNLIAPPQIFEDLDFNQDRLEINFEKKMIFEVQRDLPFDGLLLWIQLYVDSTTVIDTWSTRTGWEPAYLALEPFALKTNDTIEITAGSKLAPDSFRPDYFFEIVVWRQTEPVYNCVKNLILNIGAA